MQGRRLLVFLHLLLLFLVLSSCRGPAERVPGGQPDILLLVVPGWRADRQQEPSAERALMQAVAKEPALEARAAYAQSTSTFVSVGSMLTGRYPSAVPLCGPRKDTARSGAQPLWCATIPEQRRSLPEVLALYGYRTAVLSARGGVYEDIFGGFQQDLLGLPGRRATITPLDALPVRAAKWWNQDHSQPRLLLVLFDDLLQEAIAHFLVDPDSPSRNDSNWYKGMDAERVAALKQEYARQAAQFGRTIATLMAEMEPAPDGRARWSVLTSSQGASLGELGGLGTGPVPFSTLERPGYDTVLERTIHVPMAFYGPGTPQPAIGQVVELVDLFPTLAAMAAARPPASLPGEDLLALEREDSAATAYAEFGDMLALRRGPYLLGFRCWERGITSLDPFLTEQLAERVASPDAVGGAQRDFRTSNTVTLHDVSRDPMQDSDLMAGEQELGRQLLQLLYSLRTGAGAPPSDILGPEQLKALRDGPRFTYW